jgi:predicted HicB family RNase H-like nuclease
MRLAGLRSQEMTTMPAKPRKMLAINPKLHQAVKSLARKRKASLNATTEQLITKGIEAEKP